jgi:hypothetical protein
MTISVVFITFKLHLIIILVFFLYSLSCVLLIASRISHLFKVHLLHLLVKLNGILMHLSSRPLSLLAFGCDSLNWLHLSINVRFTTTFFLLCFEFSQLLLFRGIWVILFEL